MPMSARLLRPRSTGFHPEAQAWRNAVIANGGAVSGSTLTAVSNFCRSIEAAGIRDKFYRLNLFCGENLNAALVPLYRGVSRTATQLGNAAETNNNFVSGDFANTGSSGGFTGSTNKSLSTGILVSSVPQLQTAHMMISVSAAYEWAAGSAWAAGTQGTGYTTALFSGGVTSGSHFFGCADAVTSVPLSTTGSFRRRWLVSRTSSTLSTLYRDGTSVSTYTVSQATRTSHGGQISVFSRDGSTVTTFPGRLHCYSFGDSMDATQAAAFDAAIVAFLSAMGRS